MKADKRRKKKNFIQVMQEVGHPKDDHGRTMM
jgi:hypothetical protein